MMQKAHKFLGQVRGQQFYKLMGSGKGMGFNPLPDWSIYALLQIWNCEEDATTFFKKSKLVSEYKKHSNEQCTLFMRSIKAAGEWNNANPFEKSSDLDPSNPHLAIITRATIKTSKLRTFWKYVPTSEKPLKTAKGLIYTKGIGEVPLLQMATFSLWETLDDAKAFAYGSKEHQVAVQKTRTIDWYKEELFSRFQPYKTFGTWEGSPLLPL